MLSAERSHKHAVCCLLKQTCCLLNAQTNMAISGCSPVSQFLSGFKLERNLLPRKHLSPLADVVHVVCAGPLHLRDGVHAAAVRQRHPVFTPGKHTATVILTMNPPSAGHLIYNSSFNLGRHLIKAWTPGRHPMASVRLDQCSSTGVINSSPADQPSHAFDLTGYCTCM